MSEGAEPKKKKQKPTACLVTTEGQYFEQKLNEELRPWKDIQQILSFYFFLQNIPYVY
jgi:hypothetical protein